MIEVVLTPSCCSTAMAPSTTTTLRTSEPTKIRSVASGLGRPGSRSSMSRRRRAAQPAAQKVIRTITAASVRLTRKSPP